MKVGWMVDEEWMEWWMKEGWVDGVVDKRLLPLLMHRLDWLGVSATTYSTIDGVVVFLILFSLSLCSSLVRRFKS